MRSPELVSVLVFIIAEVASYLHACEGEAVTKLTNEKIPYFNAPIYLENKSQIGKVEEIFGPINEAVSIGLQWLTAWTYVCILMCMQHSVPESELCTWNLFEC